MPSKRRLVKSIMENAYSTRSVFSEEAKQLKQFLLDLQSEQETQLVLKEIENFVFSPENRWRLKTDDISNPTLIRSFFARRYRIKRLSLLLLSGEIRLSLFLLFVLRNAEQDA